MKVVLIVVGALLFLSGGVWFLQGIGVLPGSVMSGQTRWVIYGAIAVVVGLVALFFGIRRKAVKA